MGCVVSVGAHHGGRQPSRIAERAAAAAATAAAVGFGFGLGFGRALDVVV